MIPNKPWTSDVLQRTHKHANSKHRALDMTPHQVNKRADEAMLNIERCAEHTNTLK